jgi:hypothetical protein
LGKLFFPESSCWSFVCTTVSNFTLPSGLRVIDIDASPVFVWSVGVEAVNVILGCMDL